MKEIVTLALFLVSVIISIGFLSSYLFKRTDVPDMRALEAHKGYRHEFSRLCTGVAMNWHNT